MENTMTMTCTSARVASGRIWSDHLLLSVFPSDQGRALSVKRRALAGPVMLAPTGIDVVGTDVVTFGGAVGDATPTINVHRSAIGSPPV